MGAMKFFRTENSSAFVLVLATVVGFAVANLGFAEPLKLILDASFFGSDVSLRYLSTTFGLSAFFFLVGTELKRELSHGMFADRRRLVPPLLAACLGVALPAAFYATVNFGGAGVGGWAIPTATDLTFSLAVFNLFGSWLGARARLFLLAFAVIDDVIAVVLVTLLYSAKPNLLLVFGALASAAIFALSFKLPQRVSPVVSIPFWLASVTFTQQSGVEAALMAVLLGLLVPASKTVGIEGRIHPVVGFVALPLFALQATAVPLGAVAFGAVFVGVAFRPITKFIGVWTGGLLGSRFIPVSERLAPGPMARVASLGGIGFTVSLLIADLSFSDQPELQRQAISGTFFAAGVTMVLGALALVAGHRAQSADRP